MDSLHIGSDELVYLKTEKISLTIKGKAVHPKFEGVEYDTQESSLKVYSQEPYELSLKREPLITNEYAGEHNISGGYVIPPMFYEQQRYELIIEVADDSDVEFWHDNYNIRKSVTAVGRSRRILSGIINFGNDIGFSDFIILLNGKEYLRLVIEVFPSKISYKEDYKAIITDVTAEVYNIIFDFLKKTYFGYRQNDKIGNSPVEFFAVINKIYDEFIKAADMILYQPHHELEAFYEMMPSHKIKHIDNRSIKWLSTHSQYITKGINGLAVEKTIGIRKRINYDNKENCLAKFILQSTARKLCDFKKHYLNLQRDVDKAILEKIDLMVHGINRRCYNGILSDINASENNRPGMSLVFSMAPGYRELYKYYLMLIRGLDVTGDIFNISVKDIAVLYEYWCFIKLNSLLRNSDKYVLLSQNIVKVQGNGLYISLVKGKGTKVKYRNITNQEVICLSYNPKEIDVPTINQKPDNVLTLEKKGSDVQYEYVFDAKYRINPALKGTYYYNNIEQTPGPEVDDINTMHRYRDAIVYHSGAKPFERTMFGAYVLFPYTNEKEYKEHRFYKSIEKVNIGGLPFLPSATRMVQEMLEQLIADSSDSAFERTTLPRGIEAKLAKVNWDVRDVLIGTLSKRGQLDICLKHRFYHIPASRIKDTDLPVRYIAIYQSKNLFGMDAGIRYYGEVTKCIPMPRKNIKEIPSEKEELYYRFEIKEWKVLTKPIAVKELGFVKYFTNLFLLEHSSEIPELWIKSEEEYRLYSELKRSIADTSINDDENKLGFAFGDYNLSFDDGKIIVAKNKHIFAQYDISEFSRRPNAVFRQMQKDMSIN